MEKSALKEHNVPDVPGVYLFKKGREVLYVGKATSLRDRVRSYFDNQLMATRGPRIVDMVTRANRLAYEATPTVLEALVREAALIKKYQPRANTEGKDDKTFLYAVITDEAIPRVLSVRAKELDSHKREYAGIPLRAAYGPFPSGAQLREALKLIRRIFPFFDTPRPVSYTGAHHRARVEFNRQVGRYPYSVNKKEYARTIRHVGLFLSGRGKELRRTLARDMHRAAREERFEDAAEMRRQLFALDHVQDVALIRDEEDTEGREALHIEAFDTAHVSGTNTIAVMIAVAGGQLMKSAYRTFRIRSAKNDDIASLKEVLTRRFHHNEWAFPRVIVIDGGKTHKKAAEETLRSMEISIPVVAVVKDERHRPREVIGALRAGIREVDAVFANAEAHRAALGRHRQARRKSMR